jgi:hypothetical protein
MFAKHGVFQVENRRKGNRRKWIRRVSDGKADAVQMGGVLSAALLTLFRTVPLRKCSGDRHAIS